MNGKLLQRSLSRVFQSKLAADTLEALILLMFGIIAITLHARFKTHLGIPGNNGLLFMAIIMTGRIISHFRNAASVSCFAASALSFLPFFGFQNIFFPITFLLPGLILDWLYNIKYSKLLTEKVWFLGLLGGLAYMTIPLSRIIISLITGFPFGAFIKYGFVIPVASHFFFGLAGASLAASLLFLKRKKQNSGN